MSLADIRATKLAEASRRQPLPSGDSGVGRRPENEAEGEPETGSENPSPSVPLEEPWGVADSITPSGIEIHYEAGPKRLYRLRAPVRLSEGMWDYSEWMEVPSVSTVLDILERGGLSWWGMRVGISGVIDLTNDLLLKLPPQADWPEGKLAGHIEDLLKQHKLTVNDVKGKAADRGTNVHKALEAFAETGVVPDPQFYPENERGYVSALVAFINDAHPVTMASELMVGSAKYGFAGRFDWLANLDFAGNVVVKTYPKRKPVRAAVSGVWLLDAKSKSATATETYKSHKIQVAGYEGAMVECGYTPPNHKGILNLWPDGRYELVEALDKEKNPIKYEAFLSVLHTYNHLQGIK